MEENKKTGANVSKITNEKFLFCLHVKKLKKKLNGAAAEITFD